MRWLKEQSNEIFDLLSLHHSHFPGLKYFRFWYDFADLFQFFLIRPGYDTARSQSPRGIISTARSPCIPGLSYCAESFSPGYHTGGSHVTSCDFSRSYLKGHLNEIIKLFLKISMQYDTTLSQFQRSMILR